MPDTRTHRPLSCLNFIQSPCCSDGNAGSDASVHATLLNPIASQNHRFNCAAKGSAEGSPSKSVKGTTSTAATGSALKTSPAPGFAPSIFP